MRVSIPLPPGALPYELIPQYKLQLNMTEHITVFTCHTYIFSYYWLPLYFGLSIETVVQSAIFELFQPMKNMLVCIEWETRFAWTCECKRFNSGCTWKMWWMNFRFRMMGRVCRDVNYHDLDRLRFDHARLPADQKDWVFVCRSSKRAIHRNCARATASVHSFRLYPYNSACAWT